MAVNERPCSECVWRTEDGCSSWDCEPVTRNDVRELLKEVTELRDKVGRAIAFWDSKELADAMRSLNACLPDISDPEWQKAHKAMGFYSPLAEVYEELGIGEEHEV